MEVEIIGYKTLITGTNGTGKTFFAKQLARHVQEEEKLPVFVFTPNPHDYLDYQTGKKSRLPFHVVRGYNHDKFDFESICYKLLKMVSGEKRKFNGAILVLDEFQNLYSSKESMLPMAQNVITRCRHHNIGIIAICHRMQDTITTYYHNTRTNIFFKQRPASSTKKALNDYMEGLFELVINLERAKYEKAIITEEMSNINEVIVMDGKNKLSGTRQKVLSRFTITEREPKSVEEAIDNDKK